MIVRRTPESILIAREVQAANPKARRDYTWPASALHDPTFVRKPKARAPMRAPCTFDFAKQPEPKKEIPLPTVTAKTLKCVAVLDAQSVLNVVCPEGGPARTVLMVKLPDRTLQADLASKSVRKVQAALEEHGVDSVACVLQGRLVGEQIADAGISGMVKQFKPKSEAVVVAAAPEAA
jgi:hypothetical protein